MVSVPDCGVTGPRFESHSCVYHDGHCDIQSWAWGLSTFSAVPGSTQPSTICGTKK